LLAASLAESRLEMFIRLDEYSRMDLVLLERRIRFALRLLVAGAVVALGGFASMTMKNTPRPGVWGDEARPGEFIRVTLA
jgi:hypothetical protein